MASVTTFALALLSAACCGSAPGVAALGAYGFVATLQSDADFGRNARLATVLAIGSVTGSVVGGLLLGLAPAALLVPGLALLLLLSAVKVWRHATDG